MNYLDRNRITSKKEFLEKYPLDFIKKLMQDTYNKKFRFKSFMAAYKFYTQYALKTNDGKRYLERYEDRIVFNALFLADGNQDLAIDLAEEMITSTLPTGDTDLFERRQKNAAGNWCRAFLIQTTDDMNSIGRTINSALQLSPHRRRRRRELVERPGGGAIRSKRSRMHRAASCRIMKLLEDSFSYSNQLGQRNGAGAVYLSVFHPDIVAFLSTKKENADEKIRVKTLSLGAGHSG